MNKPRRAVRWFAMFLIALAFAFPQWSFGQSSTCAESTLMCPDQGATTYPASINAANPDPNNNYGCLGSQPNPAWFYLHVGSSGASTIDLTNSQNQDIDFAMWGPFTDLQDALNTCGSLPAPTDCSFHPQANETIHFPSANPGNIFLLLITNFSNQPTQITASDPIWPGSNFSCIDPACQADAGDIFKPVFQECFQSSNLDLNLPPNYSGNAPDASIYDYAYLLTDASGTILEDMATPDLTTQSPGIYQVCGISYHNNDAGSVSGLAGQNAATVDSDLESTSPSFCGDITNLCVDVIIYPEIPDTNLPDEYFCPGACINGPDGAPICNEGFYTFPFIGAGGCDSTVNLWVIEKTEAESFITLDVCVGGCAMVAGTQVCAPNPTQITLSGAGSNGCDSIINVDFNEISIEAIIDASALEITCGESTVTLDGSNSTAGVSFEWKDNFSNPLGVLSEIDATQTGNYILEISLVQNGITCTDSESFFLDGNLLPPTIWTDDKPKICLGEDFDLADLFIDDLNNLNPFLTYHSDSPATPANEITSFVTPDQTTDYFILADGNDCTEELQVTIIVNQLPEFTISDQPTICEGDIFDLQTLNIDFIATPGDLTYHSASPATIANEIDPVIQLFDPTDFTILATLNDCTFEQNIFVDVLSVPTASFNLDNDKICLTDSVKVEFTGSVNSITDADFQWNFNGGIATPSIGAGPHFVKFNQPGDFEISLKIEENGCVSAEESKSVKISKPLEMPVISCRSGRDSILFEWNEVGASDYETIILTNQSGSQTSDTSYVLNNLSIGEEVTIWLTAKSANDCPDQTAQATCKTDDCPVFTMKIEPVDTICLHAGAAPFQLLGTVVGGNSTGASFWSGTGITDSIGIFNPQIAGAGSHVIFYNYLENGCLQTERTTIQINRQPIAEFSINSPICLNDFATVQPVEATNPTMNFEWNSDNGIQNGNEISWNTPGQKSVYLIVTENDCTSEIFTQIVEVNDSLKTPVINCQESLDNIAFEWNQVFDTDGYEIFINGSSEGFQMSQSFLVENLNPGDEVEITVIANSETACPNVSATKTCFAKNCPGFDIKIESVDTICQNEISQSIQLRATVADTDGTGAGTWSGQGVSADGMFDPQAAGAGTWTAIYTFNENNCSSSESLEILVQAAPKADFTITPNVCIGEVADFQFSLPTNPNSRMNFDFNFSQNDINAGAGPLGISWSESGLKTVSFTVKEGQCISTTEKEVIVFEKLDAPTIQCLATETSVEFFWDNVSNATDYSTEILSMPSGTNAFQNNNLSYTFENLNPGDEVEISLIVTENGSPCGEIEVTQTCVAQTCPDLDLVFQPIQNQCFVHGFSEQLSVEAIGVTQQGAATWSGDFVSSNGKFEPTEPGIFTVNCTYTWHSCEYFETTQIEIFERPIASFESEEKICIDSLTTLNYTGSQFPNLHFDWLVENISTGSVWGENPEVSFTESGISTISLQVEANGCSSKIATAQIQVDAPLNRPQIACISTETEVEFSWNNDAQITDYQLDVLSGQVGTLNGNSYKITNLEPNTKVSIEMIASGETACGSIKESATCATKDCPQIDFEIDPIPGICLNDISNIHLTDFVKTTYQNTSESWTWNGTGVSQNGIFKATDAGVGVHEISVTYSVFSSCICETILQVEVFDLPIADASADETILDCLFSPIMLGGEKNNANNSTVGYDWSGGIFIEKLAAEAIVERPGTYILTATDQVTGCSIKDEITVTVTDEIPELAAISNNISCFGKNDGSVLTENISGGTSPYLFALNDDNFAFEKDFNNLSSGVFDLIVQDANFCTDTLSFEITEPKQLTVDLRIFLSDTEVQDGETIEWGNELMLEARSTPLFSDDLKIEWTPDFDTDFCNDDDCSELQFRPDVTTEFTVRVENQNGCFATDKKTVRVKKTSPVFIPSAFSPRDGDGINDTFHLFGKRGTVSNVKTFRVFDRWGALVFENNNFDIADSDHGWDGRFRGKIVDSDVYVFFAEVTFVDGRTEILEGDVTVW